MDVALESRVRCYFPNAQNLQREVVQYLVNLGCQIRNKMIIVPKSVYIKDGEARDCLEWLVDQWKYNWVQLKV